MTPNPKCHHPHFTGGNTEACRGEISAENATVNMTELLSQHPGQDLAQPCPKGKSRGWVICQLQTCLR